jgi:hypothetical protein
MRIVFVPALQGCLGYVLLFAASTALAAPDWGVPVGSVVTQQTGRIAPVMANPNPAWEKVPGCAKTIAAAGVNQVMVVGCGGLYAADTIYEWQASGASGQFVAEPAGSVMLAFRLDGMFVKESKRAPSQASWLAIDGVANKVYAIGADSTVYSRPWVSPYPHHQWTQFVGAQMYTQPGQVTAIAAGGGHSQGGLWSISVQPNGPGGNKIYTSEPCPSGDRIASGRCWKPVDGAAQKVALGDDAWVVSTEGGIFKRAGSSWQPIAGCARDITANGRHVYVVGCDSAEGGANKIYRRVGETWLYINQTGKTLAVDVAGNLWIVKATGEIWRKKPVRPDAVH